MQLKAIRRAAKMSVEALAEATGATVRAIRSWEQGQREPDIAHLIALADALRCTVDQLIGRAPYP